MSNATLINQATPSKEEDTQKYIVEIQTPKQGQKVSTGGIRENGKMAAMFTHPVPYTEPKPPANPTHTDILKEYAKDCATEMTKNIIHDGIEIVWYELLRPVLRSKLRQLKNKAITTIESRNAAPKEKPILPETAESLSYDSEKVISFPQKHVG